MDHGNQKRVISTVEARKNILIGVNDGITMTEV
jgi:hypothetical protein